MWKWHVRKKCLTVFTDDVIKPLFTNLMFRVAFRRSLTSWNWRESGGSTKPALIPYWLGWPSSAWKRYLESNWHRHFKYFSLYHHWLRAEKSILSADLVIRVLDTKELFITFALVLHFEIFNEPNVLVYMSNELFKARLSLITMIIPPPQLFFEDNIDDAKYCGRLYGLGSGSSQNQNGISNVSQEDSNNKHWPKESREESTHQWMRLFYLYQQLCWVYIWVNISYRHKTINFCTRALIYIKNLVANPHAPPPIEMCCHLNLLTPNHCNAIYYFYMCFTAEIQPNLRIWDQHIWMQLIKISILTCLISYPKPVVLLKVVLDHFNWFRDSYGFIDNCTLVCRNCNILNYAGKGMYIKM